MDKSKIKLISIITISSINHKENSLFGYQAQLIKQLKSISENVYVVYEDNNVFDMENLNGITFIHRKHLGNCRRYLNKNYEIILAKDTFFGLFCNPYQLVHTYLQSDKSILGLYHDANYDFKDFLIINGNELDVEKLEKYCSNNYDFDLGDAAWFINTKNTNLTLTNDLYELINKYNMPMLSFNALSQEKTQLIGANLCDDLSKTIGYLQKSHLYNINFIVEYILTFYNVSHIKSLLNLNFVIPDDVPPRNVILTKRVAVFVYLFYEDLLDECINYLSRIPAYIDIIIATDTIEKINKIKELTSNFDNEMKITQVCKRGRDIAALMTCFKYYFDDYDYACFLHDKKSSYMGYTVGKNFRELLWDNIVFSSYYIENIISILDENDSIGLLVPPNVYHGGYFGSYYNYWGFNFENTRKLLTDLGINVPLDINSEPISVGSVFWVKTRALQPLKKLDLKNEDFPDEPFPNDGTIAHAIERIFPYIAQSEGYLTGTIYNTKYAAVELDNFRVLLKHSISYLTKHSCTDEISTYNQLLERLNK